MHFFKIYEKNEFVKNYPVKTEYCSPSKSYLSG